MLIEESVLIRNNLALIWHTFIDVSNWIKWNTVATRAGSVSGRMMPGKDFTFCLWPYTIPIIVRVKVKELAHQDKIVWTGSRFGIHSRHEILFKQVSHGVLVTSRETFRGLPMLLAGPAFPKQLISKLTRDMLFDLKNFLENGQS